MKIMPVNNAYSNYVSKQMEKPKNISTKGVGSYLVIAAAKGGSEVIKSSKKLSYLCDLEQTLKSASIPTFATGVQALVKTQDSYYEEDSDGLTGWLACFSDKIHLHLPAMRMLAVKRLGEIPDNSYTYIQLKKDLLDSMIDNGHEISIAFAEQFKNLKDQYYSTFKVELIDKCLFSSIYDKERSKKTSWSEDIEVFGVYNPEKARCSTTIAGYEFYEGGIDFNNMYLLSMLDKDVYKGYFEKIRPTIDNYKKYVENGSFTSRHKCCAEGSSYKKWFDTYYPPFEKFWKEI